MALVASMLRRHAEESAPVDTEATGAHVAGDPSTGGGGGAVHPLLAAVQARLGAQAEEVQAQYAKACTQRDRLMDGSHVCSNCLQCWC